MRSRVKTRRRIRMSASRPALWPANRGLISPTSETIHQPPGANNLRSRPRLSSYECHNLCERHDLTSIPPQGYLSSYVVRARNSLVAAAAAALFIDSPPISWFVGNTIWSRGRCHLRNCMATSVIIFIGVRDAFVTSSKQRVWSSYTNCK